MREDTRTVYISSDDQEFMNRQDCMEHEAGQLLHELGDIVWGIGGRYLEMMDNKEMGAALLARKGDILKLFKSIEETRHEQNIGRNDPGCLHPRGVGI